MFIFIAIFLLLIVVLPGLYALLVHMRDVREKAEERAKAEAKAAADRRAVQ